MLQSTPLFEPEKELSPGLKRYYTQQSRNKMASTNALSKRCKAIKPNQIATTSYLLTGIILINNTASQIGKLFNIRGALVLFLSSIAHCQYSWSVVRDRLFYFGGGKLQVQRLQELIDLGYLIELKKGNKKSYKLTETGQSIADRFTLELSDKVERLGIIKG